MIRKYKRVLAAILTAAIVLGGSAAVNAARGSGQGTGSLDIVKNPDVFDVILPTDVGDQFNYILDPTGIIAQTGGDKYASSSVVPGKTMYFRQKPTTGNGIANYDDVSDPIVIYNRSNIDVEIKIQAKLVGANGVTIADSRVADDPSTDPKMYMALKDSLVNTEKAITEQGIEITVTLASAKDAYETVYDAAGDTYKNQLKKDALDATEDQYGNFFESYSFMLTGDCNRKGNWGELKGTPPTISLVWTVDKKEGSASGLPSVPDIPATPSEPGRPSITVSEDGIIWIVGLTSDANYDYEITLEYAGKTTKDLDRDATSRRWIGVGTTWDSKEGGTLGVELIGDLLNDVQGELVKVTVKLTDGSKISIQHQF